MEKLRALFNEKKQKKLQKSEKRKKTNDNDYKTPSQKKLDTFHKNNYPATKNFDIDLKMEGIQKLMRNLQKFKDRTFFKFGQTFIIKLRCMT